MSSTSMPQYAGHAPLGPRPRGRVNTGTTYRERRDVTGQDQQLVQDEAVVVRAQAVAAVLARNAAATEQNRRPTAESLAAVADLGGFALAVPRELGGTGAALATIGRVLIELGSACPATAWVLGTGSTSKRSLSLGLRGDALVEAFREPDLLFCGSGAPTGQASAAPGGVRVSGRWPMVSGCESASTAVLEVLHDRADDTPPAYSMVHLPTSHVDIERTWDAAGLNGTGSHTVVLEDVFVPSSAVGRSHRPPGSWSRAPSTSSPRSSEQPRLP